jgi:hypothetical protein
MGVLAVLDGGALEEGYGKLFRREARRKLHPLQFQELGAITFYRAALFNRTPKYIMFEKNGRYQVLQMPLAGLSGLPIYRVWRQDEYAHVLAAFTGLPTETIKPGRGPHVVTWLRDADGKPQRIDLKKFPMFVSPQYP